MRRFHSGRALPHGVVQLFLDWWNGQWREKFGGFRSLPLQVFEHGYFYHRSHLVEGSLLRQLHLVAAPGQSKNALHSVRSARLSRMEEGRLEVLPPSSARKD